jgi:hypothetical protein
MADLGLGEYCLSADSIDIATLKSLFDDIEKRRDQISAEIEKVVGERSREARAQFTELSRAVFET